MTRGCLNVTFLNVCFFCRCCPRFRRQHVHKKRPLKRVLLKLSFRCTFHATRSTRISLKQLKPGKKNNENYENEVQAISIWIYTAVYTLAWFFAHEKGDEQITMLFFVLSRNSTKYFWRKQANTSSKSQRNLANTQSFFFLFTTVVF